MIGAVVLAAWTAIGPGGTTSVRAIVHGSCPAPLHERAAPGPRFDVRSCELQLPHGAKAIRINGKRLPVAPAHVRTVAVLGDTGCRVEIVFFQACNDPAQWPFPTIARKIAAMKPDVIVHVGDYYYRETPCLVPQCAGSPHGDTWAAWAADFFVPAAPMFAIAPILEVRGNHEICDRGGGGWERFLSLYPYAACSRHEPAYAATVGGLRFYVIDSSSARDDRITRSLLNAYKQDFAGLRHLPEAPTWLVMHRPLWAVSGTFAGGTTTLNATLEAAEGNASALPLDLVVSGHVHLFEALAFGDRRPPQLVVGTGGDTLGTTPPRAQGVEIDGTTVERASLRHDFGFALIDVEEHSLRVYDRAGTQTVACRYERGAVDCEERQPRRSP